MTIAPSAPGSCLRPVRTSNSYYTGLTMASRASSQIRKSLPGKRRPPTEEWQNFLDTIVRFLKGQGVAGLLECRGSQNYKAARREKLD